jgi:aspergillopepsin I
VAAVSSVAPISSTKAIYEAQELDRPRNIIFLQILGFSLRHNMLLISPWASPIILTWVASVYAKPTPESSCSPKPPAVATGSTASPQAHLARVYDKFQADKPQDLVSVLTHELVVATPGPYDARYLCPVTIGGQTLNLTFDTGSADLYALPP